MTTRADRRVITFYAFKGGVGRTMALANVAFRLADLYGLNVIAVDFDLEAPGLHSFFDISARTVSQSPGVLDYCEAWEKAIQENAAAPPDPVSYLLAIKKGAGKPSQGAVRLMLAGRLDETYDARLGRFDWKRFYAESAGAGAMEHLRNALAEQADIVLIDSRTGLTDPGGICTIQIPDAVVLMTAPNKQSIEGIERVARSIATASPEQRGGRTKATSFLCMGRVPIVEETFLAQKWFGEHKRWFESGVKEGLWTGGKAGIQEYVIPQRAAFGFNEALVGRADGALAREPLAQAYDALTAHLLTWTIEKRPLNLKQRSSITTAKDDQLRYLVTRFEQVVSDLVYRRGNSMTAIEAKQIRTMLDDAAELGYVSADESALRERLAEIEATPALRERLRQRLAEIEAQSLPSKTKRQRTKKSPKSHS